MSAEKRVFTPAQLKLCLESSRQLNEMKSDISGFIGMFVTPFHKFAKGDSSESLGISLDSGWTQRGAYHEIRVAQNLQLFVFYDLGHIAIHVQQEGGMSLVELSKGQDLSRRVVPLVHKRLPEILNFLIEKIPEIHDEATRIYAAALENQ